MRGPIFSRMAVAFLFAIFLLAPSSAAGRQPGVSRAPQIFYTDLLSGPATGGQDNQGTFVTLSGAHFGSRRGASIVTLGGAPVATYPEWSDKRIVLQVGQAAKSGLFVVHLASSAVSNEVPFIVRSGRILFAGPDGDDGARGTFSSPWRSLIRAKNALLPGDILYLLDGLVQNKLDKYESALSIQTSGLADKPIAIVAYPGAHVELGSFAGPRIAVRTPNISRTSDHWVLAGMTFLGNMEALDLTASTDWRIINNDFSCPQGFGPSGCVETSQASYIAFLGNTIHDVAQPRTTKAYHALYFSTDSNHIEAGWNTIRNVRGCRAIQFHSSPLDPGTGKNQYDLLVHDNSIHDVVCDGINFATVDPSRGPVRAYRNLLDHVGTGPDPADGSADYACIYVQGGANSGPAGSGIVELEDNVLSHCGGRGNTDSGAIAVSGGSPKQRVLLKHNQITLDQGGLLLSPNSVSGILTQADNSIH